MRGIPRVFSLCMMLSNAQAEVLDVLPKFVVNQRLKLEITRSREDSAFKLANGINVSQVVVTVKAVDPSGFTLEWTPIETVLPAEHSKIPLIAAGAKIMNGIPITFRMSERGELRQLLNLEETNGRFQKGIPEVTNAVAAQVENAAERKKFQEVAPKSLNLGAGMQPIIADITLWTTFNGFTFDTDKPVKSRAVGPHPIDVGKIASDLEIAVKVSAAHKEMSLAGRQAYDTNGFAGLLRPLLLQSQLSFRPDGKIPEVNMIDVFEYTFDTDRAWAKRASRTRSISIDPLLKRADTLTIVVKSVE